MKISSNGVNLIKRFEGYRLKAYKCPAGVWTIGYGHTKNVREGMTITSQQCDDLLLEDVHEHEIKVMKYNSKYNFTQNEFDALVSFSFNIGSIDQLTAKGSRSKYEISEKMLLYNKANGVVLKGLVERRKAEYEMFVGNTPKIIKPTIRKGSMGCEVTYVQIFLKEGGFYQGDIDGKFGQMTSVAVKEFQKSVNIRSDGIVGEVTWSFIL